jgi:hypothetical protein
MLLLHKDILCVVRHNNLLEQCFPFTFTCLRIQNMFFAQVGFFTRLRMGDFPWRSFRRSDENDD